MHRGDDVAIARVLALELRALARKRHPAVARIALRAPALLLRERRQVTHQVPDEVRVEHPLCHIVGIDRTDLLCQHQFGLELVGHRLELGIHGFDRACRDIRSVMGELEPFELGGSTDAVLDPVDKFHDRLGLDIVERPQVHLDRIAFAYIDVQGFLVDLGRIDPAR